MDTFCEIIGLVIVISVMLIGAAWALDRAATDMLRSAHVLRECRVFMANRLRSGERTAVWKDLRPKAIVAASIVVVAAALALWVL